MIEKYSIDLLKPNWPKWKIKFFDFFLLNFPLLKVKRINRLIENNKPLTGAPFIQACCDELGIKVEAINWESIPKEGPLTIAANHPGGADVMALIAAIGKQRGNLSVLANSLVCVNPVKDIVIPVDKLTPNKNKVDFNEIDEAYKTGRAVVFFAAGMNSRPDETGKLVDRDWRPTFLQYAIKYKTPVILMHINKGNSPLFFKVANFRARFKSLAKIPLENIFQLREFVKAKGDIQVQFSNPIPYESLNKTLAGTTKKEYRKLAGQMKTFVYEMNPSNNNFKITES